MPARVVVLGGGVGGTLAANLLARQLGRDVHVTVVDPTGMHVYQPGFLYAALGRANGRWLARDERTLLRREVELAVEGATLVEPDKGLVRLAHGGSLPFDYLLLATGARLVPDQIPGLVQGAHEFYSLQGALRLREALRGFKGGRVLVGVAGIPYKCPPAPVEFTLMLDQYLRQRGVRGKSQVTLLSPLNRAFTIESASKLVQPIMQRRGIGLETFFNVETVDPSAATVSSLEGDKADYDLLVLVPPHRGQRVIEASGLGDAGGWVPTDRATLQHRAQGQLRRPGDVLSGDRRRARDRTALRLRAPPRPAGSLPLLACGQVGVQPAVLGHRPARAHPREESGMSAPTTTTTTLDCKGLSCPMPIVKTAVAIKKLAAGELVEVLATDAGSVADFTAWSRSTGNELVEQTAQGGVYRFVIRTG